MGEKRQIGWLVHWSDEDGDYILLSPTYHRSGDEWSEPLYIDPSDSERYRHLESVPVVPKHSQRKS